jgi:ferredoxin
MRVHVDDKLCTGQGRCFAEAPDVYTSDEDGYCKERHAEFSVPDELAEQARRGADWCPQAAITCTDGE